MRSLVIDPLVVIFRSHASWSLSSFSGRQSPTPHGTAERGVASAQSQPRVATSARITTREISLQSSLSLTPLPPTPHATITLRRRHYHLTATPPTQVMPRMRVHRVQALGCLPGRTSHRGPPYPAIGVLSSVLASSVDIGGFVMHVCARRFGSHTSHYRLNRTRPATRRLHYPPPLLATANDLTQAQSRVSANQ
jgi:hypothetical protein